MPDMAAQAEIEVTTEMIEAGISAYWSKSVKYFEIEEVVETVFRAMLAAQSLTAGKPSLTQSEKA